MMTGPNTVSSPETRRKRPEDTPEGCRALAADDLRRAEAATAGRAGWRYRDSARAWMERANLLDRLHTDFEAIRILEGTRKSARRRSKGVDR